MGASRFGYYSNLAMLWLGMRFLRLAYIFVWIAAIYFFLFVPSARRGSMRYLDLLHAPKKRGLLRRYWQTYRHMVEFGKLILDRALMLARPGHRFFPSAAKAWKHPHAGRRHRRRQPFGYAIMLSRRTSATPRAWSRICTSSADHRPIHIVMYQDAREPTGLKFHMRHRHARE